MWENQFLARPSGGHPLAELLRQRPELILDTANYCRKQTKRVSMLQLNGQQDYQECNFIVRQRWHHTPF